MGYPYQENTVLQTRYWTSRNFFTSNLVLQHYLQKHISKTVFHCSSF
jgi:hypothetical protein